MYSPYQRSSTRPGWSLTGKLKLAAAMLTAATTAVATGKSLLSGEGGKDEKKPPPVTVTVSLQQGSGCPPPADERRRPGAAGPVRTDPVPEFVEAPLPPGHSGLVDIRSWNDEPFLAVRTRPRDSAGHDAPLAGNVSRRARGVQVDGMVKTRNGNFWYRLRCRGPVDCGRSGQASGYIPVNQTDPQ
jgi:hypothetical protein